MAVQTMSRLNTTLLGYARGGSAAPGLVDLGAVVRETLSLLGRVVPPEIDVRLDVSDQLPGIQGIRSELEQLVLNLVINACDAMPRGGELKIGVRRSVGAVLVLEIADTGEGMVQDPSLNGRTLSTKRIGAGLGLGIVHAVVERHRGAINIAPAGGGGTVVVVMLPTA